MTELLIMCCAIRPLPLTDRKIVVAWNAMTLNLFAGLGNRTEAPLYTQQALVLATALSANALAAPEVRWYTLIRAQTLTLGGMGNVRPVSSGAVRVAADIDRAADTITLQIKVKDGWHVVR